LHRASVGHYLAAAAEAPMRTPNAFGPLSRAPSGTTLMMSASDLIAFARAHMALGRGPKGARILSAESARAMQQVTVDNRGKGYTYLDMGLGWMVSDEGLLHHAGGGPGIVSVLYAHPAHDFAAAILTNAEYGLSLVNELLAPWIEELGNTEPLGVIEPSPPIELDRDRYVGVYEETMVRFSVSRTMDGLALSRQARVAYADYASSEPTPSVPLIPLGHEQFLLDARGDYRLPEGSRVFTFRNPDAGGRMQHLGNVMRLYKRVS
jgi:CubicO group peptidase (beta-lactamase class C family)